MRRRYTRALLSLILISFVTIINGQNVKNTRTGVTYSTIQAAINAANPGDSITIADGTYTLSATLNVNKSVILAGQSETGVIIDASGLAANSYGIIINAKNIKIYSLTVQGDSDTYYGIQGSPQSDNYFLESVTVKDFGKSGFTIVNSINISFNDITALNNGGNGLSISNCQNVTIDGFTSCGNAFSGGFSAGIGIFSNGFYQPGGPLFSGNISIQNLSNCEPIAFYIQDYNGQQTGTVNIPSTFTHKIVSLDGADPTTTEFYEESKSDAYSLAKNLILASSGDLADSTYVEELATGDFYVSGDSLMTIQAAVDLSTSGQNIYLDKGVYTENIVIDHTVSIMGNLLNARSDATLDGSALPAGSAIKINTGVHNVLLTNFTIQNYTGTGGNSSAGIYGQHDNNGLTVDEVDVLNYDNMSGFYANGPVENITIDSSSFTNTAINPNGIVRGIVIWNGLKKNITITNNTVSNNNCCGIELQDGSATGILIANNTIHGVDNGIGLIGLTSGSGLNKANIIKNNTIQIDQRFGIEIKNPLGTGNNDPNEDGAIIVKGNNIFHTVGSLSDERDLAGIAVYRRAPIFSNGNPNVPQGVVVIDNTINNFKQNLSTSNSTGFGIVVEGTNDTIGGNTLINNDVGLQIQAGHAPYTGNGGTSDQGDQSDLNDDYFGRGNAPFSCGIAIGTQLNISNFLDFRTVGFGGNFAQANQRDVENSAGLKFCSIQNAIDDATTAGGDVIIVGAGVYKENVVVDKELTLQGANASIPGYGTRGQESVVYPGSSKADRLFWVQADNVTIDGFTIDGDNPDIITGWTGTNGADIDAFNGIENTDTSDILYPESMKVVNNIIQNFAYFGIFNFGWGNFKNPATSGHLVAHNLFKDLGMYNTGSGYDKWGGGVLIYNDNYTRIVDNVMTNVRLGIQTGNFHDANPGSSDYQVIANNTMSVRRRGIFYNLHTGPNVEPLFVNNNTITGISNPNESDWDGILISSQRDAQGTVSGNSIDGAGITIASQGIEIWNVDNSANPIIENGTINNVDIGVYANNYDGYNSRGQDGATATIKDLVIDATDVGIKVLDDKRADNTGQVHLTIDSNVVIKNSDIGLLVEDTASVSSNIANTEFENISTYYIQVDTATNDIDAAGTIYDIPLPHTPASSMTPAQIAQVENKIIDKDDNSVLGQVYLQYKVHNITQNRDYFTIQAAIDAANSGDEIKVEPGVYKENVVVDKPLTIKGANAGIPGNNTSRGPESVVYPVDNGSNIFYINSPDVTIDGFLLNGDNPDSLNGDLIVNTSIKAIGSSGVVTYEQGFDSIAIVNNIIKNLSYSGITIYGYYDTPSDKTSTGHKISNNLIKNIGTQSSVGVGVLLYNNSYANVADNEISNVRVGIQTGNFHLPNQGSTTYQTISNNTITAWYRGIFHNLAYSNAEPFTIKNNTITGIANSTNPPSRWMGIMLSSLSESGNIVENNTIDGSTQNATGIVPAYYIWNVSPAASPLIKGGSVNNVKTGILATNYDVGAYEDGTKGANAIIQNIILNGSVAAIKVLDDTSSTHAPVHLTIDSNVVVKNSPIGLLVENSAASVSSDISNMEFENISSQYVKLVNNTNDIDATGTIYNGTAASTMNYTQIQQIENDILDQDDNSALGQVILRYFVHNITQVTDYLTIQAAVDAANTGDVIEAEAGTFKEIVTIDKQLELRGANYGISGSGSRGNESTIQFPDGTTASSTVLTVDPGIDGVIIDGFEITDAGASGSNSYTGIYGRGNNIIVRNNIVEGFNHNGIIISGGAIGDSDPGISNILVEQNLIKNTKDYSSIYIQSASGIIRNNKIVNGPRGIQIQPYFHPGSGQVYGNSIKAYVTGIYFNYANKGTGGTRVWDIYNNNITVSTSYALTPWPQTWTVEGAWQGISVRTFAAAGSGTLPTANFYNNVIDGTGAVGSFWTSPPRAIEIINASGNATFENNIISNVDIAIKAHSNSDVANMSANNNSFTSYSTAIVNNAVNTLNATCNWYGVTDYGTIASKISGAVDFEPYLVNGTDNQSSTPGFQPVPGSCTGTPVVIDAVATTNELCSTSGSITVTFSGGTSPYNISWSGASSGSASGITSAYTIPNPSAGTYSFTITDDNGSTATGNATINYLPVENTTDGTYYATIQAAVNSASGGDVIEVCAGTYNETVTINTPITLNGAQADVDPRPSVGSTRTRGGSNESIITAPTTGNVITINADNVVINGFDVQHTGGAGDDAIECTVSLNTITVKNNIVENAGDEGIQFESGKNYLIKHNFIYNPASDGVNFRSYTVNPLKGSNQKIIENDIVGSSSAYGSIYLYGVKDVEIAGNVITTKSSGIAIGSAGLNASLISVHNNVINTELRTAYSSLATGISVDGSGSVIEIANNIIQQTGTYSPPSNIEDQYNLIRIGIGTSSNPSNVSIHDNYLNRVDNENYIYVNASVTNTIDAPCNWYSASTYVDIQNRINDNSATNVLVYVPYLTDGTNNAGAGVTGFVPLPGVCAGPVHNITQNAYYPSIQSAVNAASANNVIEVLETSFTEPGQVHIDKSLTIQGQGMNATTVYSNYNTNGGYNTSAGWFITDAGTDVTIRNLTLDGNGKTTYAGIRFRSNGVVDNVHFNDMFYGTYGGVAVQIINGNVDITNSKFTNIGRIGAHYRGGAIPGATISGTFDSNIYIGKGNGDWIDYALDITGGTTVTVSNNYITGNTGVALSDGSNSGGILVSTYYPTPNNSVPNNVTIINNTINGNTVGIGVGYSSDDISNVVINNNDLSGNTTTISYSNTTQTLDAGCNWYGTTDMTVIDASFAGNVSYCTFLDSGTDGNTATGFQPSGTCVDKVNIASANLSGGFTYCYGDTATLTIDFDEYDGDNWTQYIRVGVIVHPAQAAVGTVDTFFYGTMAANWRATGMSIPMDVPA